jgi:hypothetical protein
MPRNSKKRRFPSEVEVTTENVGDFLFCAAKNSEPIRSVLVKALVAPGTWFPILPQISDRDLVTAIRVTDLGSVHWGYRTPQHDAWVKVREALVTLLRSQVHNRSPLSVKDVGVAILVFRLAASYYKLDIKSLETDFSRIERDRDVLRKLEMELIQKGIVPEVRTKMLTKLREALQGKDARQPRRGRRFSEHDQRILAAIMLLHCCHTTKEEGRERVAVLLASYGKKLEADSLRALETRYRKACRPTKIGALGDPENYRQTGIDPYAVVSRAVGRPDAFVPPEKLPEFWLERIGWFLLDRRVQQDPPGFLAELLSPRLRSEWIKCLSQFPSSG